MKKYTGVIALVSVIVIIALFSGCVTQTNQPRENLQLNQTIQRPVPPQDEKHPPPPDQTWQSGNESQKNGDLQFVSNPTNPSGFCLVHTKNNAECKDCCDSLPGDANTRKNCRDACAVHDFSLNTDFITVSAVSLLGPGGNYSMCADAGSETACKECCDGSSAILGGDRRFCRDVCNAMGNAEPSSASPQKSG